MLEVSDIMSVLTARIQGSAIVRVRTSFPPSVGCVASSNSNQSTQCINYIFRTLSSLLTHFIFHPSFALMSSVAVAFDTRALLEKQINRQDL